MDTIMQKNLFSHTKKTCNKKATIIVDLFIFIILCLILILMIFFSAVFLSPDYTKVDTPVSMIESSMSSNELKAFLSMPMKDNILPQKVIDDYVNGINTDDKLSLLSSSAKTFFEKCFELYVEDKLVSSLECISSEKLSGSSSEILLPSVYRLKSIAVRLKR